MFKKKIAKKKKKAHKMYFSFYKRNKNVIKNIFVIVYTTAHT